MPNASFSAALSAERANLVWGLENAVDLRTIWRESGRPRLWLGGGNRHQWRHYFKFLALKIKARDEGIAPG